MSVQITEGVNLHVFNTTKYKTIDIQFKFRAPLNADTITSRALLAAMLETNSFSYPTQTDIGVALSELYGAGFWTTTARYGTDHVLHAGFSMANPKFLATEEDVLKQAFQFMKEVLFHPNVTEDAFNTRTFTREKDNLKEEYASYKNDKQLYAALKLNELYYPDLAHQMPGNGRLEDLEKITPESLFQTYQQMIEEDLVDILVVGDVSEEEMLEHLKDWPFTSSLYIPRSPLYVFDHETDIKEETEVQNIAQAKLNFGFDTGVYYLEDDYFAGRVFNGLFGGYPHSKLFVNVREKESLAYYASSSLSSFTGKLTVQSGIDSETADKTERIILEQLTAIRNGDFTQGEIDQTKAMMTNSFLQEQDSPSAFMRRAYRNLLVAGNVLPDEEWHKRLAAVSKEDITDVANRVQLRAKYVLKGGAN